MEGMMHQSQALEVGSTLRRRGQPKGAGYRDMVNLGWTQLQKLISHENSLNWHVPVCFALSDQPDQPIREFLTKSCK